MKTQLLSPVALSDQDITSLKKLLMNAWSAEYALRITPVIADDEYLQNALQWTFPQAFYTASFSLRGVLLTLGHPSGQTLSLLAAAQTLHRFGLYEGTGLTDHFLGELFALRNDPTGMAVRVGLIGAAAEQKRLIAIVETIAITHERHIIDAIGSANFAQIITELPAYLQDFVIDRFFILTKDEEVKPC